MIVRELQGGDSIEALTALLHRAYKELLEMGLRYVATSQSPEVTRRRIEHGRCLVAEANGTIVGTVTYHRHSTWDAVPWFQRPEVASVGQFAVDPPFQRRGIGSALMSRVEAMAGEDGATELALSTAEPARHLIDFYQKRGYRTVDHTDATLSNGYRSVILSKAISAAV